MKRLTEYESKGVRSGCRESDVEPMFELASLIEMTLPEECYSRKHELDERFAEVR
jgi:hypothetical protein